MKNKKLVFLSTCAAVLSLTACGNKAESNVVETATPAPTATASPAPTATPIPENHDIDTAIDQFKDENNIEINPDDIGTDISDIDSLHDWLYSNGVTRESVQNDRDAGCKNPYLYGYLEYLDSLVDKSAGNVASADNHMVQPDGAEMTGETMTVSGIEFKLDSTGGAYDQDGYYWSKSDLDSFIKGQKELAELDKANRANENILDETNTEPVTQEEIEDFIKNDLHGTMK